MAETIPKEEYERRDNGVNRLCSVLKTTRAFICDPLLTMKTPEEDAESLVRHRNRAALTSDERNDTIHSEKSFKEVGKALCEEQTVNNPTERNARLRPRGLGRQATSTRQSSGEQSTGQATASSARLQLTMTMRIPSVDPLRLEQWLERMGKGVGKDESLCDTLERHYGKEIADLAQSLV